MELTIKNVTEIIKKNKLTAVCAVACIGVILLFAGNIKSPDTEKTSADTFDQSAYIDSLEQRIGSIVADIKGAGNSRVMINIVSTTESVYVKENKKSYDSSADNSKSETEDSIITMTDKNGDQYALVTKQIMPQIGGVTVVCDGGGNQSVKAAVITAVSTVLDIGANKVCVIAKAN